METKERDYMGFVMDGFVALLVNVAILAAAVLLFVGAADGVVPEGWGVVGAIVVLCLWVLHMIGFTMQEPNEARVMVFFGKYKGTCRRTGFFWVNPLLDKKKVSLRARNLNPEPIKVNDLTGNPIMIGLVMVWRLKDTYKALFEIDSQTMAGAATGVTAVAGRMRAFENFVRVQSDAALRQVAGRYATMIPTRQRMSNSPCAPMLTKSIWSW